MTRAKFDTAMNDVPDGTTHKVYVATIPATWPNAWRETEATGDAVYDAWNVDEERHML